jgi:putative PIN family toxin of toxin-antitoxin system
VRVVLDASILVAFLLTRGRAVSAILDGWENGAFELLVSPPLLDEVRRTLEKPELRRRIRPEAAQALLEALEKDAVLIPGNLILQGATPAPDDAIVLCAVEGNADSIVSRDLHLLGLGEYEGIPILDPTAFARE